MFIATAVSRVDNLEFLSDVIPRTIPYKAYVKGQKAKEKAQASGSVLSKGQTTLTGRTDAPIHNGANGNHDNGELEEVADGWNHEQTVEKAADKAEYESPQEESIKLAIRSPSSAKKGGRPNGKSTVQHVDVEMEDE
jgi:hypothetical protein